ncbi:MULTISPECIES: LacI family DNA-binding transcriptional regulator [Amycolatopsis]|uniref:LacI family DNA-binding transcriptional regulator n=1 Tax=Amycolatopsis dendrobii TaxID=2760662 RepID=A0A7W3ZEX9_9PSEU|nr:MULTISPECIES: LacI family DNA-binding transcriptional regulator [Amycolatopsis]MBB1158517.1 LacI family DNA-binding transcriptional regulator [Amycolatopsis dendrobii]UKD58498.1 LacI family transcriptional regulator [Amycolatopsis sp. FU40]
MATISDVAARAGVSTATVSRTLNGKSTVDPELAARVLEAAEELGYHPNGLARNLRRQETAVLALIISDVENPFFTSIARGVEDLAQVSGYSVVLCNSDENEDKERRYLDVALQERVAGVLLSPTGPATSVTRLRRLGIPVVAVDRPLPGTDGDQVLVDTRRAARQATRHLVANSYRRVACLTGPPGVRTADDRLSGYFDAVGEENAIFRRAEYRAEGARHAAGDLLDQPVPPDALLVANSTMAIGVLEALAERSLRAGRDIGIVSFDDAPWTTLIDPPLTVVAQPAYEIGRVAAQLLLARIADSTREPVTTTLDAQLIDRQSSHR